MLRRLSLPTLFLWSCSTAPPPPAPTPEAPAPRASSPETSEPTAEVPDPPPVKVLETKPTKFGELSVVQTGDLRSLMYGDPSLGDDHGSMLVSDPNAVPTEYVRNAAVAFAFFADDAGQIALPATPRILVLGLAAGRFANLAHKYLPTSELDVVESSPNVIDLTRRYFRLDEGPRYRIHKSDPATFFGKSKAKFDLIFVNDHAGRRVPKELHTKGFYDSVKKRINATGVVLLNLEVDEDLETAIVTAFRAAFPNPSCFRTSDAGNLIVIARASSRPPHPKRLVQRARTLGTQLKLPFDLGAAAQRMRAGCGEED